MTSLNRSWPGRPDRQGTERKSSFRRTPDASRPSRSKSEGNIAATPDAQPANKQHHSSVQLRRRELPTVPPPRPTNTTPTTSRRTRLCNPSIRRPQSVPQPSHPPRKTRQAPTRSRKSWRNCNSTTRRLVERALDEGQHSR